MVLVKNNNLSCGGRDSGVPFPSLLCSDKAGEQQAVGELEKSQGLCEERRHGKYSCFVDGAWGWEGEGLTSSQPDLLCDLEQGILNDGVPKRGGGFECPKCVRDCQGLILCPEEEGGTGRDPSVVINGKISAC